MKKIVAILLLVVMALCLAACGKDESGVKVYTVEAKSNSETINQWKKIVLLDEDTYILTVDAVDSRDATRVTANFVMKGSYTLADDVVTLEPGYGSVYAMNGDTPITMQITPESAAAMYGAMMGSTGWSWTLEKDGTFTAVE